MKNFCSKCGYQNDGTKKFCKKCGAALAAKAAAPGTPQAAPGTPPPAPAHAPVYGGAAHHPLGGQAYPPQMPKKSNKKLIGIIAACAAVLVLVVGIGFVFFGNGTFGFNQAAEEAAIREMMGEYFNAVLTLRSLDQFLVDNSPAAQNPEAVVLRIIDETIQRIYDVPIGGPAAAAAIRAVMTAAIGNMVTPQFDIRNVTFSGNNRANVTVSMGVTVTVAVPIIGDVSHTIENIMSSVFTLNRTGSGHSSGWQIWDVR